MTIVFDGRDFAAKRLKKLKEKVTKLRNQGIYPKIASIIIGNDPASKLYVSLKKKRAAEIGIKMDVYSLKEKAGLKEILSLIKNLNNDKAVGGIMVQLPLPQGLNKFKEKIINEISPFKDVDGLREKSLFSHPTALAIMEIIDKAQKKLFLKEKDLKVTVVGAGGMVGKKVIAEIGKSPLRLIKETKRADVVVSATGKPGLIKPEMVKNGVILVDVGSPVGDVSPKTYFKASFYTPVPGGVGPLTIAALLENLILSSYNRRQAH